MADKYDDLLAIRNQSAQQAALRQIQNQAQSEVEDYQRYLAEGDTEKAAWAARGHQALVLEYNTMLANMRAARQQQQAQPQQDQQQYTPAEMDLMRELEHGAGGGKQLDLVQTKGRSGGRSVGLPKLPRIHPRDRACLRRAQQ